MIVMGLEKVAELVPAVDSVYTIFAVEAINPDSKTNEPTKITFRFMPPKEQEKIYSCLTDLLNDGNRLPFCNLEETLRAIYSHRAGDWDGRNGNRVLIKNYTGEIKRYKVEDENNTREEILFRPLSEDEIQNIEDILGQWHYIDVKVLG